ncbi:MAG: hypothetical protein P8N51_05530 [Pseudomonadales bacterium]|nr:hypothetical protein [Pseudomonadales bacterium]MDG1444166.1 hypothetical protein [Pseudomonadales bacterium]
MIVSLGLITDPQTAFAINADVVPRCVLFKFSHNQFYNAAPNQTGTVELSVILLFEKGSRQVAIINNQDTFLAFDKKTDPIAHFKTQMDYWNVNAIDLLNPWKLQTEHIKKPWGQEIWYTGIEARGVCRVNDTPLPWLLDLDENILSGQSSADILLLKILDPLPDSQYGELYFEVHEHKIEVYVVTHVDSDAWPSGTGQIRYGFSPKKRALYPTDQAFKAAYLQSVQQYQSVRNQIDGLLETKKQSDGHAASEVVSPTQQRQWLAELPQHLCEEEIKCREAMYAFTNMKPIRVGDVIRVKPLIPHSLQNGVRVIEFQTAHYERHILSFAQKVMTQDHWDTETVLDKIDIDTEAETSLKIIESEEGVLVETIAEFPEFTAIRVTLNPSQAYEMNIEHYGLVIGVAGCSVVSQGGPNRAKNINMEVEQAYLIPGTATSLKLANRSEKNTVALVAVPNLK